MQVKPQICYHSIEDSKKFNNTLQICYDIIEDSKKFNNQTTCALKNKLKQSYHDLLLHHIIICPSITKQVAFSNLQLTSILESWHMIYSWPFSIRTHSNLSSSEKLKKTSTFWASSVIANATFIRSRCVMGSRWSSSFIRFRASERSWL